MKTKFISLLSVITVLCLSSWGFLAHKTLQQVSIYFLPNELGSFFYENQDYLVKHSVRPDLRRNEDKSEDPKHYLDMDAPLFGKNYLNSIPHDFNKAIAKYTLDSLKEQGLVPWEVTKVYQKLVKAFKEEKRDSVLFYAADLGHYVSDAHVPLHTTINHDGQLTGQKGMHVLWETLVPENDIQTYQLYDAHSIQYIKNPQDFMFEILKESHAMLPEMFQVEKEVTAQIGMDKKHVDVVRNGKTLKYYSKEFIQGYANRLGKSVQQRMMQASFRVACFWYSAYIDAGKPAWVKQSDGSSNEKLLAEKVEWKENKLIVNQHLLSLHKGQ
jgi:hypothetical protein